MKDKKVLLYIVLVAVGMALFLVAWFLPWWTIDVEGFACDVATIRPWGLEVCEQMGDFAILMKGTSMPAWFTPVMWVYFVACLAAFVVAVFTTGININLGKIKIKLSQLLVGGVGFSYIFAGVFSAIYAGARMKDTFNVPLQGRAFLDMGEPLIAYVDTRLLPGWYMLYVAGLFLLLIAIFQDKILGKTTED